MEIMTFKNLASTLFLIAAANLAASAPAQGGDTHCQDVTHADMYILGDASNSINSVGWGRLLNFSSYLIGVFPYGPQDTQFAWGIFSTTYQHVFNLNTYLNRQDAQQRVLNTTQLKMNTNTAGALRAIRERGYLTDPALGHRLSVPAILLIITDGQSDNPNLTIQEAIKLRTLNITIIVVGVGSVNASECKLVAGDDRNFLSIKSFGALNDIKALLTQRICQVAPTTPKQTEPMTPEPTTPEPTTPEPTTPEPTTPEPTTPEPTTPEPTTTKPTTPEPTTTKPTTPEPTTPEPTTPKPATYNPPKTAAAASTARPTTVPTRVASVSPCVPIARQLKVVFVIDSSGSIGEENYRFNFQFVAGVVKGITSKAKFALITYGTHARLISKLTDNREAFLSILDNVPYQKSTTRTDLGISLAVDVVQSDPSNDTVVVAVITDGKSTKPDYTQQVIQEVQPLHYHVLSIGVGNEIDRAEIESIASRPEYVLRVTDYKSLLSIIARIAYIACAA